jgi:hypothetical protein
MPAPSNYPHDEDRGARSPTRQINLFAILLGFGFPHQPVVNLDAIFERSAAFHFVHFAAISCPVTLNAAENRRTVSGG